MHGFIGVGKRFAALPALTKIVIIASLCGVVWFGVSKIKGRTKSPAYQTATAEKGTIISTVSASGSVLVSNIYAVNTQASGTVSKVYVKNGDPVQEGQTIAEIALDTSGKQAETQSYASYLSAKNNLDSALATLYTLNSAMWTAQQKFVHGAAEDGLPTDDPVYIEQNSDWLAAEAKYKNQQAVIAQAQVAMSAAWNSYQLTRGTITAPKSGTITGINITEGMQVGSSDSSTGNRLSTRVAAVTIGGAPLLSLSVNEIDVPRVEPGQKVTVTVDSLPDKTFTGTVASVDKIGSVASGVTSYPVIVRLDTEAPAILPNMSVTGNIITATKNDALLVPSGAVSEQNGEQFVRVLRNGRVENVTVETGLTSDTQTEIVSGISEGDTVVTGSVTTSASTGSSSPFGGFGGQGVRVFRRD